MTLLEQFAAAENAAMLEVMRDNRGVQGRTFKAHGTMDPQGNPVLERRAKRVCDACGQIVPLDRIGHFGRGNYFCGDDDCLAALKRWNRWTRQTKL